MDQIDDFFKGSDGSSEETVLSGFSCSLQSFLGALSNLFKSFVPESPSLATFRLMVERGTRSAISESFIQSINCIKSDVL